MELRIRELREDKDYTQKFVANYLKCDQSLYCKYELGKREIPFSLMIELTKLYNVSLDYLAGLAPRESINNPTQIKK